MTKTGTDIGQAADLLLHGKLVAIPTETVYGLAANALNEKAVLSVFEAKNRPFFDPLILHVDAPEAVHHYAHLRDPRLVKLAAAFWPGPLTLLLPKKESIPPLVTSGLPQVAIRVPAHPLTLALLKKVQVPLAAPSANPFGYVSPTSADHVRKQLGEKIDYILDGGPSAVGIESTIVGLENDRPCVYRLGGLSLEDIEAVIGPVDLRINNSSNPKAPGQLKSHYAPKKPLVAGDAKILLQKNTGKKIVLLCFGEPPVLQDNMRVFNLSKDKSLPEAALNLFSMLRLADDSDADLVICDLLPETGLGRAINDRLRRAGSTEIG